MDVTFATNCWERDWPLILKDPHYLATQQISHHNFPFAKKMLIVNNVSADLSSLTQEKIATGVITDVHFAEKSAEEVFSFFQLQRSDFAVDRQRYPDLPDDWLYYNALAPLSAIYHCETPWLLYMTGDVFLPNEVRPWIEKAIRRMEKDPRCKVANLLWNDRLDEAKRESIGRRGPFYLSDCGFSDQMFLVRREDFRQPIYNEIRADADHFPRGDVFEKRVFSYMRNHGWLRLTFRKGSYSHT